jgi:phage terminase small subunit
MALNGKQKRFCEEYVIDFNQTRAYKAAYPNTKTVNACASSAAKLLRNANIQNYLGELQLKLREKNEVTAQMVIDELAKLAFHNVKDFINGGNSILELKTIDKAKTAAVSGIKTIVKDDGSIHTELKFHSKDKALQLLGQHFGIFEMDNAQKKTEPIILNFTKSEGCEPLKPNG